jgi:hypothetical protein
MNYIYKVFLIILIVSPIRLINMKLTAGDPSKVIYPLLTIISSMGLTKIFNVNIINQFIISISTIVPNIIISIAGMGGGPSPIPFEIFATLVQIIFQGIIALLLLNKYIKYPIIVIVCIINLILPIFLLLNNRRIKSQKNKSYISGLPTLK